MRTRFPLPVPLLLPLAAALLTTACDSGRDLPEGTIGTTGDVAITLANGDDGVDGSSGGSGDGAVTSFVVDVRAITLARTDGTVVAVLPRTTRVDLADADAAGELVANATVAAGTYGRATVDLDFAHARARIAGQATHALLRDRRGNDLASIVPFVLDFPSGARVPVRPRHATLLRLQLDLAQSMVVDAAANTITFAPVWAVEVDPATTEPPVLAGVLQRLDLDARTFTVERRAIDDSALAEVTVLVGDDTVFHIDGQPRVGAIGLGLLQPQLLRRLRIQGRLDAERLLLRATAVEAGAGTDGDGRDRVHGVVVARSGGIGADATLSVLGRSRAAGGAELHETVHTVLTTRAATAVVRRGSADVLDSDAIAVGQRVQVSGTLTGTTLDAGGEGGVVRLLRTTLAGVAAGPATGGELTLDLVRLAGRDVAAFDFSVGGTLQADPHAFRVAIGELPANGVDAGRRIAAVGWIEPLDAAGPDALALAIGDRTAGGQLLVCRWNDAAPAVLAEAGDDGLVVDVRVADERVVRDGFAPLVLDALAAPVLRPAAGSGFYNLADGGHQELHRSWTTFRDAVRQRLGTGRVARVGARGTFDAVTQEFTARSATVVLD